MQHSAKRTKMLISTSDTHRSSLLRFFSKFSKSNTLFKELNVPNVPDSLRRTPGERSFKSDKKSTTNVLSSTSNNSFSNTTPIGIVFRSLKSRMD